jgi:hypothetical protein
MGIRITELQSFVGSVQDTDLLEISVDNGVGGFNSRKITGAQLKTLIEGFTLYEADGTISSNRIVDVDGNSLAFNKIKEISFSVDGPTSGFNPYYKITANKAVGKDYFQVYNNTDGQEQFRVMADGKVEINSAYTLTELDGTADQVLTTDGAGSVTFENQTIGKTANSTQLIEITDGADIPSTLAANTTYLIRGTVTTSTEVTVSNEGSQIIGLDRSKDKIIFNGIAGTTFLTITDVNFSMSDVWLASNNSNTTLIDATNVSASGYNNGRDSILAFVNVQFRNCFDVMDIKGFDLVDFNNCLFFYIEATNFGCRFQDVSKLEISSCEFIRWFRESSLPTPADFATCSMIELRPNSLASFGAVNLNGCIIHPQQTQNGIDIDTSSTTGFGTISSNAFVNVGLTTGVVFNPVLSGLPDYSQTATYNFDVFANQGLLNSTSGAVMTVSGNTTDTALTTATPTAINTGGLATAQASTRYTVSTAGRLTYNGTKQKYVSMHGTLSYQKQGAGTDDYNFSLYKNGVLLAGSEVTVVSGATFADGTISMNYGTLMEQNDYIEIYCENPSSADDMLVKDLQFVIRE